MAKQHYDLLVIGSGAAGSSAVTTIDKKGLRIALVERGKLGGTCLNYGCDPTKSLLYIANMLYEARHASKYGLHIPEAEADWAAVQQWTQDIISRLRGGTPDQARAKLTQQGIDVLEGEARFLSAHEISVSGYNDTISAERIIIATGSETLIPPIEGLDQADYITNIQAVSLPTLPRRMAIAGGGAIGIEFAQLFHRFGVEVTVLERGPNILDTEDLELATRLCKLLTEEGIRLETNAELKRVQGNGDSKRLTIQCGERDQEELEVDELLIAVGRRAAFASLNLEAAGVKTSKKGIIVDETLRTSVPHIWAAGDVASPYQFTHVASEQGKLAVHNAFSSNPQPFDDRVIPWGIFTYPPLAHVGKTEQQLQQDKVEYRAACVSFNENERAITGGKTEGLIKLLVDAKGTILGGHILGTRADDLLAPLVLAMHASVPIQTLASTILPYPTVSEIVRLVAEKL
ncbi:MAG TPA: NAD(P)/FAD-dependent oxidoreductase [Ktedonobacteraceae bacterium]|nr:NAD(P)/FAD-dependent oxidoreductase [Ktedonobacteraceae bacterium]